MIAITATVNGASVEAVVPPRMTLVEFLRDHLGLTGTKVSCELQVCGACSVLVDGRPVSACTYLAVEIDGRTVETVEGLSVNGRLSAVQRAFMDNAGLQCGFCTSGFQMMATSLLRKTPHPTEAEVRHYLEGNICRCTGYRPIVDSVLAAAASPDGRAGDE